MTEISTELQDQLYSHKGHPLYALVGRLCRELDSEIANALHDDPYAATDKVRYLLGAQAGVSMVISTINAVLSDDASHL